MIARVPLAHAHLALFASVSIQAAGCGAAEPPTITPSAHTLVWTSSAAGERETWVIDDKGDVVSHAPGVRVAVNGTIREWREDAFPIATWKCPDYDANGNELPPTREAPEPGKGVRATLGPADGAGEATDFVAPAEEEGAQEIEQSVALIATVGPYLFVREATYVYACGAHGGVAVRFVVWDAARDAGGPGTVWTSDEPSASSFVEGPLVQPARAKAIARLGADEDVAMFADQGAIDAEETEIVPSYDAGGALSVGLQVTAFSCYACSDGAWSSYSKSAREPLDAPPAILRPWAAAPEHVRALLAAHPELTLGGWSTQR
jgi:hypothetical protein